MQLLRRKPANFPFHLLHKVHLPRKAERFPDRRAAAARVAIVRAMQLARVLYDEPTSALEPQAVGKVLKVMNWLADKGITSIVVTHEMSFAQRAADRVIFPDGGKIAHSGSTEEFFSGDVPERVARFLGRIRA